jgi:dTDP-glucose 4,6-dehydratase
LEVGDIADSIFLDRVFATYRPRAVVHFAAESHVDRSISNPEAFVQTNIVGTFRLLESAKKYWECLPGEEKVNFRFLHVSTDEVYGTLDDDEPAFCEESAYAPTRLTALTVHQRLHQIIW